MSTRSWSEGGQRSEASISLKLRSTSTSSRVQEIEKVLKTERLPFSRACSPDRDELDELVVWCQSERRDVLE